MLLLRVGRGGISGVAARPARENGVSGQHTESGREAFRLTCLYGPYDLVLVDFDLPDMSGHEFIRLTRAAGFPTPSIMLVEQAVEPRLRIQGLDQGVDDVVTTPCHPEELLARARALLRRVQGRALSVVRLGPLELDRHRREVWVDGRRLFTSRGEFSLLELMCLNRDTFVTRDMYRDHLGHGEENS